MQEQAQATPLLVCGRAGWKEALQRGHVSDGLCSAVELQRRTRAHVQAAAPLHSYYSGRGPSPAVPSCA